MLENPFLLKKKMLKQFSSVSPSRILYPFGKIIYLTYAPPNAAKFKSQNHASWTDCCNNYSLLKHFLKKIKVQIFPSPDKIRYNNLIMHIWIHFFSKLRCVNHNHKKSQKVKNSLDTHYGLDNEIR